jgi:hypothetical protein
MEINGRPFYIKSKNDVPYIYDIDTHDEVGFWSSKKGAYVMFSLYGKLMNDLRLKKEADSSFSDTDDVSSSSSELSPQLLDGEEGEEGEEGVGTITVAADSIPKNRFTNYSLVMLFFILFMYLTLQKEIQSVYFDFVFIILINLSNTYKVFELLDD